MLTRGWNHLPCGCTLYAAADEYVGNVGDQDRCHYAATLLALTRSITAAGAQPAEQALHRPIWAAELWHWGVSREAIERSWPAEGRGAGWRPAIVAGDAARGQGLVALSDRLFAALIDHRTDRMGGNTLAVYVPVRGRAGLLAHFEGSQVEQETGWEQQRQWERAAGWWLGWDGGDTVARDATLAETVELIRAEVEAAREA